MRTKHFLGLLSACWLIFSCAIASASSSRESDPRMTGNPRIRIGNFEMSFLDKQPVIAVSGLTSSGGTIITQEGALIQPDEARKEGIIIPPDRESSILAPGSWPLPADPAHGLVTDERLSKEIARRLAEIRESGGQISPEALHGSAGRIGRMLERIRRPSMPVESLMPILERESKGNLALNGLSCFLRMASLGRPNSLLRIFHEQTVLDLGSGARPDAALFLEHDWGMGARVHAMDPNMRPEFTRPGRYVRAGIEDDVPKEWIGYFDSIVSFWTFNWEIVGGFVENMGSINVPKAAANIRKMLKPGGLFTAVAAEMAREDADVFAQTFQTPHLQPVSGIHMFLKPPLR